MYGLKFALVFLILNFFNPNLCDVFTGGNYHGPKYDASGPESRSAKTFNQSSCKTKQQSPINLDESYITKARNVYNLKFGIGYKTVRKFCIQNTGHTVQVEFKKLDGLTVSGLAIGGKDEYIFQQMHFHWGKDETIAGSEHAINGIEYAGEIHLVHIRSNYTDFDEALANKYDRNSILVIGILMEDRAKATHLGFHKLSKSLACMNKTKTNDTMTHLLYGKMALKSILPHVGGGKEQSIFRYQGSLTTPPCAELVRWLIFKNPIKVTNKQMNALRNLYDDAGNGLDSAKGNVRKNKAVNNRIISEVKAKLKF